jgi:hypothetical protein
LNEGGSGRAKFVVNPPHSDIWCELSHTSGEQKSQAGALVFLDICNLRCRRTSTNGLARLLDSDQGILPEACTLHSLLRLGTPQFSSKAYMADTARGLSTYDPASHHNCTLAISPAELGGNRRSRI